MALLSAQPNFLAAVLLTATLVVVAAPPCPAAPPGAAGTTLRVTAKPAPVVAEAAQAWSAFDDSVLSGPFTLAFRLETHEGKPPAGRKWALVAGGLMPGDPPARVVAEGVTPESGLIEVTGLGGIEQTVSADELKRQRRFAPWYSVVVNGRRLGQVSFFEWGKMGPDNKVAEFLPPADGKLVREREYTLPPEAGDAAPDATLVDVATSRTIRLSDLRGQVVLLEFWSSKCHSCEPVMAKNEELVLRRGKDWLGKAQIVAANIDNDISTLAGFLKEKGWKAVRHTWSGEGGTGRYSQAAKAFVITGTPVAILIGRDGTILWRGSPRELNVEQSFDKLIAAQGN